MYLFLYKSSKLLGITQLIKKSISTLEGYFVLLIYTA